MTSSACQVRVMEIGTKRLSFQHGTASNCGQECVALVIETMGDTFQFSGTGGEWRMNEEQPREDFPSSVYFDAKPWVVCS